MLINKNNLKIWKKNSNLLEWKIKPKKIFERKRDRSFRWYSDGKIDLYYNLITKTLKKNPDKTAIITLSKNHDIEKYSYKEIDMLVNNFSFNLLSLKKINKVIIHSSATLNSAISMLSCIKNGIFFSVIFKELPIKAISTRIKLFKPNLVITENKKFFKNIKMHSKNKLSVYDFKELNKQNDSAKKKRNKSKNLDPNKDFFCLFTSGSTGEPKGVVHSYGGYSVYTKYTCKKQFGMNKNSIVLTASDAGWINGHTYSLFGPLFFGATTILCENPMILLNRQTLQKLISLGTTILYLPVTLIRLLKSTSFNLKIKPNRLKAIGSMGEPLAPSIGLWYCKTFRSKDSSIVNTYFQTETGGIISSPKHNSSSINNPPGSVGDVLTKEIKYKKLHPFKKNEFIITQPWPGCMKKIINGKEEWEKYWTEEEYFKLFDYATKKKNNIYIHGRIDDVINIRGHRIGSEELESIILKEKKVSECCAISCNDKIEGSVFYLFVVSKSNNLNDKLNNLINSFFGSFAIPRKIFYISQLPKTRSGKILRRLLRNLINKEKNIGDISTILNPEVLKEIKTKINL